MKLAFIPINHVTFMQTVFHTVLMLVTSTCALTTKSKFHTVFHTEERNVRERILLLFLHSLYDKFDEA
jgi:hypothetical protein